MPGLFSLDPLLPDALCCTQSYHSSELVTNAIRGLLFQEDVHFTIYSEAPPEISDALEIPEGMEDPRGRNCWLLKERNWLFDFETKTLYKLKKRKSIDLPIREHTEKSEK
jgi:hypothetical protein